MVVRKDSDNDFNGRSQLVSGSEMVLGTAQLGMPYGIANTTGVPREERAREIVRSMWDRGVRIFDTAQHYGGSEEVLGRTMAVLGLKGARVITKLHPETDVYHHAPLRHSVQGSLDRLRSESLWAVLIHREEQIDEWNGRIPDSLSVMKREGLLSQIGVSVYTPQRALKALSSEGIDLIQIPTNVFDRRFSTAGVFDLAHAKGKAVYIRSIYLQGLALLSDSSVPRAIPHAARAVRTLRNFCQGHGISVPQFAMDYVRWLAPGAKLVVGAETPEQAINNCSLYEHRICPAAGCEEWTQLWPEDLLELIDPRNWPKA